MSESKDSNDASNIEDCNEKATDDASENNNKSPAVSVIILFIMMAAFGYLAVEFESESDIRVVAAAVPVVIENESNKTSMKLRKWRVSGLVMTRNNVAADASVFAMITDDNGNQFTGETIAKRGRFDLTIDQGFPGEVPPLVEKVQVSALHKFFYFFHAEGEVVLWPEATGGTKWTNSSATPFIWAIAIFSISIIANSIHSRFQPFVLVKYWSSVILGTAFTGFMIYFIATTSQQLGGASEKDEVISLGFAHVFFGTYVEGSEGDWLLSLTTPTPEPRIQSDRAAENQATNQHGGSNSVQQVPSEFAQNPNKEELRVSEGFGAPLWVLLLSVIGSSLYTIKLVVESAVVPPNVEQVNRGFASIVQHQFYVLFAPIGAMFIYQLLVIVGGASETITVSFAALASGLALNGVLERAWQSVSGLLEDKDGGKKAPTNG